MFYRQTHTHTHRARAPHTQTCSVIKSEKLTLKSPLHPEDNSYKDNYNYKKMNTLSHLNDRVPTTMLTYKHSQIRTLFLFFSFFIVIVYSYNTRCDVISRVCYQLESIYITLCVCIQVELSCPKEMAWKVNMHRGYLAICHPEEQQLNFIERLVEMASSLAIREWRRLPHIVSHVHTPLLQVRADTYTHQGRK